jgi:hypothetical protein
MAVDPVAGITPPTGTIVHNQAEYDALGGDLKLLEDAFACLPLGIGHQIDITLRDGIHLTKVGTSGIPGFEFITIPSFQLAARTPYNLIDPLYEPVIRIVGENRTVSEASQAGTMTTATRMLVRSTGTWTTDQHAGKTIRIVGGAHAGKLFVIASNDTTTVTLRGVSTDFFDGACNFEIVVPSSVILASTDGATADSFGLITCLNLSVRMAFDNIQFGSTLGWMSSKLSAGSFQFSDCRFLGGVQSAYQTAHLNVVVTYYRCAIILDGSSMFGPAAAGPSAYGLQGASLNLVNSVLRGNPSSPLVEGDAGAHVSVRNTSIIPDPGFAGTVIYSTGAMLDISHITDVKGNGSCVGFSVDDNQQATIFVGNCDLKLVNCGTAVRVKYSRLVAELMSFTGSYDNGIGWEISNGAQVSSSDFSVVGATTPISLDGQTIQYTDLVGAGDEVKGVAGSVMTRTV